MAIIQRSFEACDIPTTNPGLVHNDDFLKRIIANVEVESNRTDDDDDDDDDDDMFKEFFEN